MVGWRDDSVCKLCKDEDLNSDPQDTHKKQHCDLNSEGTEMVGCFS